MGGPRGILAWSEQRVASVTCEALDAARSLLLRRPNTFGGLLAHVEALLAALLPAEGQLAGGRAGASNDTAGTPPVLGVRPASCAVQHLWRVR